MAREGGQDREEQVEELWLESQLPVANKMAHELILEPPSQEDLQTEVEEGEPERVTEQLHVDTHS